jgi:hypothetical protein
MILWLADHAAHAELIAIAHGEARPVLDRDPHLQARVARPCAPFSTCSAATKPSNTCAPANSREPGI